MGRKRIAGLEWLDPINTEQRRWADGYLRAKGLGRLFYYSDENQPKELPSHEDMQRAGMKIEQEGGARELFRDMKDAWRQEKSRNKKKETGRQVCAFTFSTTTKNSLQKMAMEQGTSATELLETLISKAHKAHASKAKKQKTLPSKPEKTASNTFAGGRQPSVGGTETAQGLASLDENAQIELEAPSKPQGTAAATAPPITDNQEQAIPGGTSTPDTHEQSDNPQAETPTDDELAHNADRMKKSISDIVTGRVEKRATMGRQAAPSTPHHASQNTPQPPDTTPSHREQETTATQHGTTRPAGYITEE